MNKVRGYDSKEQAALAGYVLHKHEETLRRLAGWYPQDNGPPTQAMLDRIAAEVPQDGFTVIDSI